VDRAHSERRGLTSAMKCYTNKNNYFRR